VKRSAFLLLTIILSSLASAPADETTRALQTKLKEGGFYFGEVNDDYTSETAAALTRYQIRNGLEISGQLDAKTAQSLGVTPPPGDAPAPPTDSETWRRLRKSDEQFLRKINPGEQQAGTNPAYAETLVLSRERLRDYVAAFVLAGLDPSVDAELEFFADRVNYFNEGIISREKIRRDLERYARRWPSRSFSLAGEVEVEPRPDSRLRVTFPLRYELRNGSKHSSGEVRKTIIVEVTGEDLQIVGVDEQR
jgi:hypothetical protein